MSVDIRIPGPGDEAVLAAVAHGVFAHDVDPVAIARKRTCPRHASRRPIAERNSISDVFNRSDVSRVLCLHDERNDTPMRIAVAGSHGTGKSTLVAELVHRTAELVAVEEPYYRLLSAGHAFSEPPTIADFEVLVEAAVATFANHTARPVAATWSPRGVRGLRATR